MHTINISILFSLGKWKKGEGECGGEGGVAGGRGGVGIGGREGGVPGGVGGRVGVARRRRRRSGGMMGEGGGCRGSSCWKDNNSFTIYNSSSGQKS